MTSAVLAGLLLRQPFQPFRFRGKSCVSSGEIRCRFVFSGKNDEPLLRKSGPELAGWRDNPPGPHEAPGVHCLRGGVLPWCRTRFHGTDIGAP